jgi:hypothetical protein
LIHIALAAEVADALLDDHLCLEKAYPTSPQHDVVGNHQGLMGSEYVFFLSGIMNVLLNSIEEFAFFSICGKRNTRVSRSKVGTRNLLLPFTVFYFPYNPQNDPVRHGLS